MKILLALISMFAHRSNTDKSQKHSKYHM